jgi:TatD DNase family protein
MKCSIVDIHTHRPTGKALEPSFAGIHPWQAETRRIEEIVPRFGEVDLVGEIGLDYAGTVGREAQLRIFREQLDWAERLGKPVVLHCVKAFEAVMRELAPHALRAVIFHGFIGSPQQAAEAVKRGYYLSFGPRSLRSPRTVRALGSIPTQRLFLETDDAPATIESVYATAARLLGMPLDRLKETIYNNYLHIFS